VATPAIPDIPGSGGMLEMWEAGRKADVIDILAKAHPCVTAVLLVTGISDRRLSRSDCNEISNMLLDLQFAHNGRLQELPDEVIFEEDTRRRLVFTFPWQQTKAVQAWLKKYNYRETYSEHSSRCLIRCEQPA